MPSRKKNKGKARRAKAAAAVKVQDPDLAALSLGGKGRCDHGGSALQANTTALLDEYESELKRLLGAEIDLKRLLDAVNESDGPVRSYVVHCGVMASLQKKGLRVDDLRSEDFADGLVRLGVDWISQGRWHYSQPFSPMATVAAITHTSLVLEGAHEEDMNEWGERETVRYFEGRSQCSCLNAVGCDHGRPNVPVGGVCWSYMHGFETVLIEVLGEGCDINGDNGHQVLEAAVLGLKRARVEALNASGIFCEAPDDPVIVKDVVACLLSLGTNFVLSDNRHSQLMAGAAAVAVVLRHRLLEEEGAARTRRRVQDLTLCGPCEWTRFFADRISCSCLAERKKNGKGGQKMSYCWHCGVRKKRRELLMCSGCEMTFYCNETCQAADWQGHKATCVPAS